MDRTNFNESLERVERGLRVALGDLAVLERVERSLRVALGDLAVLQARLAGLLVGDSFCAKSDPEEIGGSLRKLESETRTAHYHAMAIEADLAVMLDVAQDAVDDWRSRDNG